MAEIIINQNELGKDIVTNGIFGNSNLTPAGTFPNLPQYYQYSASKDSPDKLVLTLQKVKDSLKTQLDRENNTTLTNDSSDDSLVESFLYNFVTLLVDYKDIRNYVFYGSAYAEIAFNIQYIVKNFPYKFLVSTLTTTLNTPASEFNFTNDSAANTTTFLLNQSAIKDAIEQFNFYDNNLDFNWLNYDLVDNNGARYPVLNVITPYSGATIFAIAGITSYTVPLNGTIPAYDTLKISTSTPHGYLVGQSVNIYENTLQNTSTLAVDGTTLDNNYIVSKVVSATEFLIASKYALSKIIQNDPNIVDQAVSVPSGYTIASSGRVRMVPLSLNTQPYTVKIVVQGNISTAQLISYLDGSNTGYTGFMLSQKQSMISEWEYNLTPVQRMLLAPAPVNPTPWPVRIITQNIQNLISASPYNQVEGNFLSWLQSPSNLYIQALPTDDPDIAFSDVYTEYRLVRALSLDETTTNQLVRRCIPHDMISELNDTSDGRFQRFIMIAGWFFDQIRLYIKFIKYVHHINYGDFDQLSPEYYKYYADYYGFDLFSDDSIDFSESVVKTEPGFYFIDKTSNVVDPNSKYYKLTIKQLTYERQKRLLLSLFYLYRQKGTPGAIKKLVSLLGAPDGFLVFNEFAFDIEPTDDFDYYGTTDTNNNFSAVGQAVVDNKKIYAPKFHFEKDPNYPVSDPSMPAVYRMRLHNESTLNLRTASILTNPNGAVDSQIINVFGKQKYNYAKFQNGEFGNLQTIGNNYTLTGQYYGLPLSLPDKFAGLSLEYMIPRNGFLKGTAGNLDEVSVHLCSLYQLPGDVVNNPIDIVHGYPLPEVFSNFDYASVISFQGDTIPKTNNAPNVASDFATLNRLFFDTTSISITNPYIIVRLEGKDVVIRTRLQKENVGGIGSDIGERVAIYENLFEADGLNHLLRFNFTPSGVEIYEDYSHLGVNNTGKIGIALWRDPTTSGDGIPYCAFEIPKTRILNCLPLIYDGSVYFTFPNDTGSDVPKYWDLFIGYPSNIDFYFKRIEVRENYSIDSYDIDDKIDNPQNYTAQYYSFDFSDNAGDTTNFSIRSTFEKVEPDIAVTDYSYILPVEQFNSKVVVKDLTLTPKTFFVDKFNQPIAQTRYFNRVQDFFNVTDYFGENAYSPTLHKDYYYSNFHDKLTTLYQLYSPQVLTYALLSDFLNLIEGNFQKVIKTFIPIVINISEFGRMIANSAFRQEKIHYANIEKLCNGTLLGSDANVQVRIYDVSTGIQRNQNLILSFVDQNAIGIMPPITIIWAGSTTETLGQILLAMNSTSSNTNFPNIQVQLNDDLLIFTINSNWYFSTFGLDVNQAKFIVSDGTHSYQKSFSNGVVGSNSATTSCGSIQYSAPFRATDDIYIFFDSENQPPPYIFYDSEEQPDTFIGFG